MYKRQLVLLAAVGLISSGCDELLAVQDVELTVKVSATCSGRLAGPVSVYVDDNYVGQAGAGSQVVTTIESGLHRIYATSGQSTWGPDEVEMDTAFFTYTLDC